MKKIKNTWWSPILMFLLLLTACQGQDQVSSKTLMLTISTQSGKWMVSSYSHVDQPYYAGSTNEPIYQADITDAQGKVISSLFFGKEYLNTGGKEFQLPFPSLKKMQRIIIYRLDASSGHITNKNRDKVLDWKVPSNFTGSTTSHASTG